MPKFEPILSTFSVGELSPYVKGRVDLDQYLQGCETLRNFFAKSHGAAIKRGGTEYLAAAADNDSIRLIAWPQEEGMSLVIECSNIQFRYWKYGSAYQLVTSGGATVETVSPYAHAELKDLGIATTRDAASGVAVMILLHNDYVPYVLARTGADSFTLGTITFTGAPTEWGANNYPSIGVIFQERLYLTGCPEQPGQIWASAIGATSYDYYTFTLGVNPTDAFTFTIDSDRADHIRWLAVESNSLMIGTDYNEYEMVGQDPDLAIGPTNIKFVRNTNYGSEAVPPIFLGSDLCFVQRGSTKLRAINYSIAKNKKISKDLSIMSEHLFRESPVISSGYSNTPDTLGWFLREDGVLIIISYEPETNITGWFVFELGANVADDTVITSVAIVEGMVEDSPHTEVFISVQRMIGSDTVVYIERLAWPTDEYDSTPDAWYVDSGIVAYADTETTPAPTTLATTPAPTTLATTLAPTTLATTLAPTTTPPTTTLRGLEHLEGETVQVFIRGYRHPDCIVSGGAIDINYEVSKALVGLGYTATLKTIPLEGGNPIGTAIGKIKRISKAQIRLYNTQELTVNDEDMTFLLDTMYDPLDVNSYPEEFFSGIKEVNLDDGYVVDGQITVVHNKPFPCTIISIMPEFRVK